MIKIGKLSGRTTVCVITDMNQPIGKSVGNTLEVIEAVDILRGKYMPKDVEHIITELGANMLVLAKKAVDIEDGKTKILENIRNGKAYEKLLQLVQNQGGDVSYIEDTDKFEKAKYIVEIKAKKSGVITSLDAYKVGTLSNYLGAGRMKKTDSINPRVGFVFEKKVGYAVSQDEVLGYIHADDEEKVNYVLKQELFEIK